MHFIETVYTMYSKVNGWTNDEIKLNKKSEHSRENIYKPTKQIQIQINFIPFY